MRSAIEYMTSINISKELYHSLQELMAIELKEKLQKHHNPQQAMLEIIRNKFGVSFNQMISKLLVEYKRHHKIK